MFPLIYCCNKNTDQSCFNIRQGVAKLLLQTVTAAEAADKRGHVTAFNTLVEPEVGKVA